MPGRMASRVSCGRDFHCVPDCNTALDSACKAGLVKYSTVHDTIGQFNINLHGKIFGRIFLNVNTDKYISDIKE